MKWKQGQHILSESAITSMTWCYCCCCCDDDDDDGENDDDD